MTVKEATGKWCPMVRGARHETYSTGGDSKPVHTIVGGCNTDMLGGTRIPASCRCIADKCAMWRWIAYPGKNISGTHIDVPSAYGYCGLAGKP
jgi:hypothetical protein